MDLFPYSFQDVQRILKEYVDKEQWRELIRCSEIDQGEYPDLISGALNQLTCNRLGWHLETRVFENEPYEHWYRTPLYSATASQSRTTNKPITQLVDYYHNAESALEILQEFCKRYTLEFVFEDKRWFVSGYWRFTLHDFDLNDALVVESYHLHYVLIAALNLALDFKANGTEYAVPTGNELYWCDELIKRKRSS